MGCRKTRDFRRMNCEADLFQHIYLTGYRGTGKTSVGRLIAQQRQMPLVDLDLQIESDAEMTIRQIFDKGGESLFRDLESTALMKVSGNHTPSVISLGGGAILRKENRDLIRKTGVCLWLDCDAQTLAGRIQSDESTAQRRPSLTSRGLIDEIEPLLCERRPLYQEVASVRVDTCGKSIAQVAARALEWLQDQP
tara:strand:+ start:327499 stop:328080 length:582 start_codon:yes stop_codon:yes gene_type:complete